MRPNAVCWVLRSFANQCPRVRAPGSGHTTRSQTVSQSAQIVRPFLLWETTLCLGSPPIDGSVRSLLGFSEWHHNRSQANPAEVNDFNTQDSGAPSNAQVQLQARYHHRGAAASDCGCVAQQQVHRATYRCTVAAISKIEPRFLANPSSQREPHNTR
jgi:hypothetical protein